MRRAWIAALAGLLVACTSGGAPAPATVAIGDMSVDTTTTSQSSTTTTSTTTSSSLPPVQRLGERVSGNRVILIGDSVLASTATRHSGAMCAALVPLGWVVDVEAETGQFAPWGNKVLDAKQGDHFDVAVLMLGNNYLGDELAYRTTMQHLVDRLAPSLVVLSTVTEFQPDRKEVNAAIRAIAAAHPEVTILDWAALTAADPTLTGPDHLHLGRKGRSTLAAEVARLLGQAPSTKGSCLESTFDDDSRGPVTGTTTTIAATSTTTTTPAVIETTVA